MPSDALVEEPPGRRVGMKRRSRRAVAALLAVAAVAGLWSWRSSLPPLDLAGGSFSGPAKVGEPYYAGIYSEQRGVTVSSAEVVIEDGSASAATAVAVCERVSGVGTIGTATGDLDDFCRRVTPVEDFTFQGPDGPYLLVTILPLEEGRIRVDGVRLHLRDGWRRGTQTGDLSLRLTAHR